MFRKIHSKRDPKDTLFSQIRLVFAPHFAHGSKAIVQKIKRHPKPVFAIMIVLITLSAVLSFTVFRRSEQTRPPTVPKQVIYEGLDQISSTAAAIQKTIALKNGIDSISKLSVLSRADSTRLLHDLEQLHRHTQHPQP